MSATLWQVRADVDDALAQEGLVVSKLELVSSLGERKGSRYAFRVDLVDGRTIKARHHGAALEAQRVFEMRAGLEPAFAPALRRRGAVILDEWIDGTPLETANAAEWAACAGGLLGRLHGRASADTARMESTQPWLDAATTDLTVLRHAAAFDVGEVAAAQSTLRQHDPRQAGVVPIHMDFCGQNMIVDRNGQLRVIDNERLTYGPAAFDLGWAYHRWGLPAHAWSEFLRGYEAAGAPPIKALAFWKIVAALSCTRVFCQFIPERLAGSLVRLHGVLREAQRTASP